MQKAAAAALSQEVVYRSAVVMMPPERFWDGIQRVRRTKDRVFNRWPPHVTLLYPFVEDTHFEEAAKRLRQRLQTVKPFEVEMSGLGEFRHGKKSITRWMRPVSEGNSLVALQKECELEFPWCDEQGKKSAAGFTPHLTVGQWKKDLEPEEKVEMEKTLQPFRFLCKEVYMISRRGDGPFKVRQVVALGNDSSPAHFQTHALEAVDEKAAGLRNSKRGSSAERHRVWVGGLPKGVTVDMVKQKVPEAVDVDIRNPNARYIFGYVLFDSAEAVQRFRAMRDQLSIAGSDIRIK